MKDDMTHVSLIAGRAEVRMGDSAFVVSRRDDRHDPASCPVELITAALGS